MFIVTEPRWARTPSGVPCDRDWRRHFTPDGVARSPTFVTINITLLAEGGHRRKSVLLQWHHLTASFSIRHRDFSFII